jgi:hypothetical protein
VVLVVAVPTHPGIRLQCDGRELVSGFTHHHDLRTHTHTHTHTHIHTHTGLEANSSSAATARRLRSSIGITPTHPLPHPHPPTQSHTHLHLLSGARWCHYTLSFTLVLMLCALSFSLVLTRWAHGAGQRHLLYGDAYYRPCQVRSAHRNALEMSPQVK